MTRVVENPVEMTFKEAIYKYQGYCIGFQKTDKDETCIYKVKVFLYCDGVPDQGFVDLMDKFPIDQVMKANPYDMIFPAREDLGR